MTISPEQSASTPMTLIEAAEAFLAAREAAGTFRTGPTWRKTCTDLYDVLRAELGRVGLGTLEPVIAARIIVATHAQATAKPKKTEPALPVPAVGQVWADNDGRSAGRTVRVTAVDETHATCVTLTNSASTQELIDRPTGSYRPKDRRGTETRISLARFKPTSTGYRLLFEPTDS